MQREHLDRIVDQFSRQAASFAASPQIRNQDALNRIVAMAEPTADDLVLDVACGPGLLACAFARVTRHVTGIDVTPEMLEQARALQQREGLENVTWHLGDVLPLPYADASFSIVSARFAFHHFPDPLAVLKDMRRVCRDGGRVVVADSAPESNRADAFNQMERLRDPSHVRALAPEELVELFAAAGLPEPRLQRDRLSYELESLLARSFPNDGDAERIRRLFDESLQSDSLGVAAARKEGRIWFSFPTAIVASTLPGRERDS